MGLHGYNNAVDVALQINADLHEFGFSIAQDKCMWIPVVVITQGCTIACPCAMLRRYFAVACLTVFCKIHIYSDLCLDPKRLSYTRARECILSR